MTSICLTAAQIPHCSAVPPQKISRSQSIVPNTSVSSLPPSERHVLPSLDKLTPAGGTRGNGVEGRDKGNSGDPLLKKPKPTTFEDVQKIIGKSGKWQLRIFLLASFSGFCTSLHNFIYGFIGAVPEHWCALPKLQVEIPHEYLQRAMTENVPDNEKSCKMHTWQWATDIHSLEINSSDTYFCNKFEFDRSEFESTVPTEWELVCENSNYAVYIQATYMIGLLFGAPIFGAISDRYGRKFAILVATVIFSTTCPLIALSPNYTVFISLRFILAFALPGVYACSYVLAIEIISEHWRSTAGNVFNLPFALGYTVLPIFAYFFRSWHALQIICSVPSMGLIVTWWFLPESPRWLIRKGRLVEAETILRKAAKVNRTQRNLPNNFSAMLRSIYDQERDSSAEKSLWRRVAQATNEYFSLIRSPRMRNLFLTLCFSWCIIGMTYYGLGLNSSNVKLDRYTYTFINGLLEFPGYLMVPFFIKYFGRKKVFLGFLWTCGFAMFISLLLPPGSYSIILLSFLGKLVIGANYSLVYLYSSELLPTLVRNCALGVCSMMGRLGSTIAPFIVDILGRDNREYPFLVFGTLTIIAGCLAMILPETQNRRLPDTIEEVEFDDFSVREEEEVVQPYREIPQIRVEAPEQKTEEAVPAK